MVRLARECVGETDALRLVDGSLDEGSTSDIYEHAVDCASCRGFLAQLARAATARSQTSSEQYLPTLPGDDDTAIIPTALGKYRILAQVGEGGMGRVFLARDEELDRSIAIKVVRSRTPESQRRVLGEARAMAKLRAPNVAAVYDTGETDGIAYIAMEYVRGQNLREWMAMPANSTPWQGRLDLVLQAGRGLLAAHREGIVHRDFKPENVMVGTDGRVQVLDFGLAEPSNPDDSEVPSEQAHANTIGGGTPAYMAPEQFRGEGAGETSDQFAFATVAYELLLESRPYVSDAFTGPISKWNTTMRPLPSKSSVPKSVVEVLRRGLEIAPKERFPNVSAMLGALESATAPPASRLPLVAVLGLVLTLAATATSWLVRGSEGPRGSSVAFWNTPELPALLSAELAGDPLGGVTVHRLSNGLTLYINTSRSAPSIATDLVFRAGHDTDPTVAKGVAEIAAQIADHADPDLESSDPEGEAIHLRRLQALYRDLEHAPVSERGDIEAQIASESANASRYVIRDDRKRLMRALGIRNRRLLVEADAISVRAEVPSNRFATWAELEAARWHSPVARLVDVTYHDTRTRLGGATGGEVAVEALGSGLLGHATRAERLASVGDVLPLADVASFAQHWLVPNNAALILSGDIDATTAIPVLEAAFAGWKPRRLPARSPSPTPQSNSNAPIRVPAKPGLEGALALGYKTVPAWHPDYRVTDLIGNLIYDGVEQHVREVTYSLRSSRDSGFLMAAIAPKDDQTREEMQRRVEARLQELVNGDAEEVHRISETRSVFRMKQRERASQRIDELESSYLEFRDWRDVVADWQRLPITADDVSRVVERYFKEPLLVHFEFTDTEPSTLTTPYKAGEPAFSQQAQSAKAKTLSEVEAVALPPRFEVEGANYTIEKTPSGPLITVPNATNSLFELKLYYSFGARDYPLLCAALVAKLSKVRREQESGVDFKFDCSPDHLTMGIHGPDEHLEAAWKSFRSALEEQLDPISWRKSVATTPFRPRLLRREYDLYWFANYGRTDHALGFPSRAILESASVSMARVQANGVLASKYIATYFGPRSAREVVSIVGHLGTQAVAPVEQWEWRPGHVNRVFLMDSSHEAGARLSVPLPAFEDAAEPIVSAARIRAAADVASELLQARISSRLQAVLSAPMDSSVETNWTEGKAHFEFKYRGPTNQLAEAMHVVYGEIARPEVTASELGSARRAAEDNYRSDWIAPRALAERVVAWVNAGHRRDPRVERFAALKAMDDEALRAFLGDLAKQPHTLAILDQLGSLDLSRLRQLGTVSVVSADTLPRPLE